MTIVRFGTIVLMKKRKMNKKKFSYVGINIPNQELDYVMLYLEVMRDVDSSSKLSRSFLLRNIIARWVGEKQSVLPIKALLQSFITKEQARWEVLRQEMDYPAFIKQTTKQLKEKRIAPQHIAKIISALKENETDNKQQAFGSTNAFP